MTKAFVFPGQGSQTVGMGKSMTDAFPEARHVFEEVDDALGEKLSAIIFEGPEDILTLTQNAQPAIMATSMAIFRVLEKEVGLSLKEAAAFVAGHSLGEYTALAAAGSLTLADTARLLRLRGQAMQQAVPAGEGAMAAIIGPELDVVQAIAKDAAQGEICTVANDNSPGQVVVSGHKAAVERACELAKEKGAKRALLLQVSAPFHCPLMQPAADAMEEALASASIQAPCVPLIANVTAEAVSDADSIRRLLVEQVTGRVRWRESVAYMAAQGVTETVEVGVGKVLTGLTRRINRDMEAACIQSPEDLDGFAKAA
ncbi:MAG: ACP S-malonyltransferase [Rickettsiales bacterium]